MPKQRIALRVLCLGPLFLLLGLKPAALPWLAWGVGLWALALLAKLFVLGPLYVLIEPHIKSKLLAAVLWGLCSAGAELGLTAWFLLRQPVVERLEVALWLGLGTGLFEIVYMLGLEAWQLSRHQDSPEVPAADAFVAWSGVFERCYTLVGHVCSRGLLALGLTMPIILVVSMGLFSFTDAYATYGQTMGWDFGEPRRARKVHALLAGVSVLEALILLAAILKNGY